jgi:peroxiredoxin (alkyl hydroperoxide reductase subunit C)
LINYINNILITNNMKKISFLIIVACCTITAWSQSSIPMLGLTAPSFTAETTQGKLDFPKDFGNSWKILFSHPKDFTPVCTSEILGLAKMQDEFEKLGVKIAIISVDDLTSHLAWKKYMEDILLSETRDSIKIKFPLIADNNLRVSNQYGMLHAWDNQTRDVRGVFIINPENKIESISFYPITVGRNLDEIKRTIQALQISEKEQVMTPANWKLGDDVLMKQIPYSESDLIDNPGLKNQYYLVGINMWYRKESNN